MNRLLKRGICLLLTLMLCCSLAACAASDEPEQELDGTTNTNSQNAEDNNAENSSTETSNEDTKPEDTRPEDTKPEDTKPEDTKPEDTKPAETKPADPSPVQPAPDAPAQIPVSFFDDAAFIGDSVTLKLRNYNTKNAVLGKATFLCQGSYSVGHAVNNTMYLSYQGQDLTPQDALAACGAKKVFILLGMNDIALYGIDKTIENWGTLTANIRAKCPDIEIYIQSGTPIYKEGEIGKLNNANMDAYNVRLQEFAKNNDCQYVDLSSYLKDSSNGLAAVYCSDKYVHFTDAACKLWIDILSQYANG